MKIFDSHTHLNDSPFAGRETEIIAQASKLGVSRMNVVGSNQELNQLALKLAGQYKEVYATVGWHPDDCATFDEAELRAQAQQDKVIAIGEIGLDYHWMVRPKSEQEAVFRRQIQLSKELGLPFQVHTRDSLEDTYAILKDEGIGEAGAIMHSFSGTYADAMRFVELGMMISFSGVVTFKKALDEQEAAASLPLDKILVETDAPYLTPVPYRGKENQPGYSRYVVEKIAELRGLSVEEVAAATTANAERIFRL